MNIRKKRLTVVALISSFAIVSLLVGVGVARNRRVLAKVGDYEVTAKDVHYRDGVIRKYYPGEKRSVGLEQLIKLFTMAQILKNNGHPITQDTLRTEAERIDRTTLRPEKLAEIRSIFGKDTEGYLKNYVLPVYVERAFSSLPAPMDPIARSQAGTFLEKSKGNPSELSVLAKKSKRKIVRVAASKAHGVLRGDAKPSTNSPFSAPGVPPEIVAKMEQERQERMKADRKLWLEEIAGHLEPGKVYPNLVEQDGTWLVVRYLKSVGGPQSLFEAVEFPKVSSTDWAASEKSKVLVERF